MTDQLTDNFKRSEFECECGCGFDTVDYLLVTALQDERDALSTLYGRVKIVITGPNRCEIHNRNTPGAAPDSEHVEAKAADHKAYRWRRGKWEQIPPQEQYDFLDSQYPDSCGIGLYSNRVHFDSRAQRARWNKRK